MRSSTSVFCEASKCRRRRLAEHGWLQDEEIKKWKEKALKEEKLRVEAERESAQVLSSHLCILTACYRARVVSGGQHTNGHQGDLSLPTKWPGSPLNSDLKVSAIPGRDESSIDSNFSNFHLG